MQVATSVRNEIRDALNQGKVVTVHEKPLDYHGWQGSGYIILDPDTAAGAYKISGGANGAFLKWVDNNSSWLGILGLFLGFMPGALGLLGVLIGLIIAWASYVALINSFDPSSPCLEPAAFFMRWLIVALGVVGLKASGVGGLVLFFVNMISDGAIRNTFSSYPACKGKSQ